MKKALLKGLALVALGSCVMVGNAMASAIATEQWDAYEYYQYTKSEHGYIGDYLGVDSAPQQYYFDLWLNNNNNIYNPISPSGTTSDNLMLVHDVEGYSTKNEGIPVGNVWVSLTIFSYDADWDGFDLAVTAYYNDQTYVLPSQWTQLGTGGGGATSNQQTYTTLLTGDLLYQLQQDPYGLVTLSLGQSWKQGEYNDLNLLEVGMGVSAIPEPATMILFGAGLVGLAGVSRKRKKN